MLPIGWLYATKLPPFIYRILDETSVEEINVSMKVWMKLWNGFWPLRYPFVQWLRLWTKSQLVACPNPGNMIITTWNLLWTCKNGQDPIYRFQGLWFIFPPYLGKSYHPRSNHWKVKVQLEIPKFSNMASAKNTLCQQKGPWENRVAPFFKGSELLHPVIVACVFYSNESVWRIYSHESHGIAVLDEDAGAFCLNFQGVFFGVSPSEDVNGIRSKELHFFRII